MDGIPLEIIAKAEVTQHFEKGVMTRCISDVFQIVMLAASANAALYGSGTGIGTFVESEENILELHHPCIGQHQGRVVGRNQRARTDDSMTLGLKKAQKLLTNFGRFHFCIESKQEC